MKIRLIFATSTKFYRFAPNFRRFSHKPVLNWENATVKLGADDSKSVENYWHEKICRPIEKENAPKKYILSMFPYPSGNLHMGHVRVYTIADCIARYFSLKGFEVLQPMGWDAFGLPAENAALERKIDPKDWTTQNIETMRQQLKQLGCGFNWDKELSTCDPSYYKWTQWIFVQLFKRGLAYKKKSFVHWDPVDKTVLALEQIDADGKSWRSGAKVERKLLSQWYVKTTKFSKALYDNIENLEDWKGVAAIQKDWLGDCRFYKFSLEIYDENSQKIDKNFIEIELENAQDLARGQFILISKNDDLAKMFPESRRKFKDHDGLKIKIKNPITNAMMPVLIVDKSDKYPDLYQEYQTCRLAVPTGNDVDKKLELEAFGGNLNSTILPEMDAESVIFKAQEDGFGGHIGSHRLKDWCVSRQRYWGTPIPIVNCSECGEVPVPESDLPVLLPELKNGEKAAERIPDSGANCPCPRCGRTDARRETDTLDTFFDSSFYFLRYLDAKNREKLCDLEKSSRFMPIDVYVGGREHAVLHLYYARFMSHFLKSLNLTPVDEPFRRLLPQGVVMAPAYCLKSTGQYITKDRVQKSEGGTLTDTVTGGVVEEKTEKMSKSRYNGVDPRAVLDEYGCDVSRLLMIGFVSPQAHRTWQVQGGLKGMHRWINRIMYLVQNYVEQRQKCQNLTPFDQNHPIEVALRNQYNISVQKVTFHNEMTFLLNTSLNDLIVFTSALRRQPLDVFGLSAQFERCLHALIVMCYPLMPHLAAEFFAAFKLARSHNVSLNDDSDIWDQKWPEVDSDAKVKLVFLDQDGEFIDFCWIERNRIEKMTLDEAYDLAKRSSADFRKFKRRHEILGYNLKPLGDNLGLLLNFDAKPLPEAEIGEDSDENSNDQDREENDENRKFKKQKAKNKN